MRAIAKNLSLREQITLLTSVLCIVVAMVVAGASAYMGRWAATAEASSQLEMLAATMADRLDRGMQVRLRQMQVLAELQALQGLWTGSKVQIRTALERIQTAFPDFTWIGFADPSGFVLGAVGGLLEGTSVASRPWFEAGIKAPYVGDVHEAKLLAGLLAPRQSGEPHRFVDFAAPVYRADGATQGVLAAHLDWAWAAELRRTLLSAGRPDTDIWVLSADGKQLLGPDVGAAAVSPEELRRIEAARRGSLEQATPAGPVLTGFAMTEGFRNYPGLGWIVLARQPSRVAFAAADRLTWTIVGLCALVAVAGVLLSHYVALRIAGPITELSSAADQIGRSTETMSLPRVAGSREVTQLSGSLRSLLRRIGTAERRVVEAEQEAAQQAQRHALDVEELRRIADTDPLSGLPNRRAFLASAEEAFAYYKRYGRSIGVLVVDIDHFKQVNDRFGHAAGDAVIREVGRRIAETVRGTDRVARFGGEEFVVLLREIGADDIRGLAERMRATVREGGDGLRGPEHPRHDQHRRRRRRPG
jgi:GGDEF domain-containing protein